MSKISEFIYRLISCQPTGKVSTYLQVGAILLGMVICIQKSAEWWEYIPTCFFTWFGVTLFVEVYNNLKKG